jgi:glutathione S-transferase
MIQILAVICQYLGDQKPEAGLVPQSGTIERYRLMEALNFASSEVHKQIGALFKQGPLGSASNSNDLARARPPT